MESRIKQLALAAVHVCLLLPLGWLVLDGLMGRLTADPTRAVIQRTGQMSLAVLLLSLAVTPLNYFFHSALLTRLRRAAGLYAFFYVLLHFLSFTGLDYAFAWDLLWLEISQKSYLLPGLAAFIILIPMAVTSFGGWQKRLEKKWKSLHRMVYLAVVLAVLHAFWTIKGNLATVWGNGFLLINLLGLIVLLILRLPPVHRRIEQSAAKTTNKDNTQPLKNDD